MRIVLVFKPDYSRALERLPDYSIVHIHDYGRRYPDCNSIVVSLSPGSGTCILIIVKIVTVDSSGQEMLFVIHEM